MTAEKVLLKVGDLFRINGVPFRVFAITDGIVGTIQRDRLVFENYDLDAFLREVKAGTYEKIREPPFPAALPEAAQHAAQERAAVMDGILYDIAPAWRNLTKTRVKQEELYEAAEGLGLGYKHFKQLLYKYMQSGRDPNVLVDGRSVRYVKERLPDSGHGRLVDSSRSEVVTKDQLAKERALAVFKECLSVQGAYETVLEEFYKETYTEEKDGCVVERERISDSHPGYDAFYRYISKHLGGLTIKQYIRGRRDVNNNERLLTGNQRSGFLSVGQAMQLDECEVAVALVDDMGNNIGKPVVYCAFDPVAQIIIGIYIGFINNAYGGVVNLFLSMLEDHNIETSRYGVECTPYEFPSMLLPRIVLTDQGSEYMSKQMEKALYSLGITGMPVPAGTGSAKGGVENVFHRLQSRLKKDLFNAGYIRETHDGADKAREDAVLTISDFKRICYQIIIELNTTQLGEQYSADRQLMEDGVPPIPAELWQRGIQKFSPVMVTEKNRLQIIYAMLWRGRKFETDRSGITYKGSNLRYFCEEDWFRELIGKKDPEYEVRYNDNDVSYIYVCYKSVIHIVGFPPAREELQSFAGMGWDAYDALNRSYREKRKEQRKKDMEARLATKRETKRVLAEAEAAHGDTLNDDRDGRLARAKERARLEGGRDEIRNRLLGPKKDAADADDVTDVKKIASVPEEPDGDPDDLFLWGDDGS